MFRNRVLNPKGLVSTGLAGAHAKEPAPLRSVCRKLDSMPRKILGQPSPAWPLPAFVSFSSARLSAFRLFSLSRRSWSFLKACMPCCKFDTEQLSRNMTSNRSCSPRSFASARNLFRAKYSPSFAFSRTFEVKQDDRPLRQVHAFCRLASDALPSALVRLLFSQPAAPASRPPRGPVCAFVQQDEQLCRPARPSHVYSHSYGALTTPASA